MKVIIVGTGHDINLAKKVIEATQKLGCDVMVVDHNPTFITDFRNVVRNMDMTLKPIINKSKFHK
tara:strand:+ start:14690 stop:14884 length:195 start_codon:yes stop_codon:yes gene_type:complete